MTNANLSSRVSAAICALLFSSIMVLSAVGPARANGTENYYAGGNATVIPAMHRPYLA